ncbi:MAG: dTMP kinase [Magnetococcales bacterium]|nr:dTMP kinase [Magnetococcales bacterium]
MRGRFITFEGIEGAGKSTQIALLADWLRTQGESVLVTREPGGTPLSERIRALFLGEESGGMLPETELYLVFAARAQHVGEVIRPALAQGTWVLCDRFQDSTLAYQGYGRGVNPEVILRLGELAAGGVCPDLTFLLDIAPEAGLERCRQRQSLLTRLDQEELAFHRRVREGFLHLASREPERILLLDAFRPSPTIFRQIQEGVAHVRNRI